MSSYSEEKINSDWNSWLGNRGPITYTPMTDGQYKHNTIMKRWKWGIILFPIMFAENLLHFRDIWCDLLLLEVDFPTSSTSKYAWRENGDSGLNRVIDGLTWLYCLKTIALIESRYRLLRSIFTIWWCLLATVSALKWKLARLLIALLCLSLYL